MDNVFVNFSKYSGEIAALFAACLWAASSLLFKKLGKTIRPHELNLIKGVGAFVLLTLVSLFLHEPISALSPIALILLLLSGALGIGFGDTMYFEALNAIGPRRTLLISILAPPMTAIMAIIFLGEMIKPIAWLGVLITILGVAWVISSKSNDEETQKNMQRGIFFGLLFAFAQAGGSVVSRWALTQTSVTALQSAIIRLFAGVLFLILWITLGKIKTGAWLHVEKEKRKTTWGILALVVVAGAFLPIWLQQISFKFTEVGIAQTLLATSPLFVLLIAVLRKEKLTLREITGVILSITGIALLFLAG